MRTIEVTIFIKDGKHKGELGVVVKDIGSGVLKVLTLEGDFHYYTEDGKEVVS